MPETARPCQCRTPSPVPTWEEEFYGLFLDVAAVTSMRVDCKGCGGVIQDWAPSAPLEPEPPAVKRPKMPKRRKVLDPAPGPG